MDVERATRRSGLLKAIGPGIVYAGAAIGVSHLVQSTRAGATYGFALLWVVLLVNLFKYPFFEFGHRYAAATGQNMIVGYRRVGRWALITFMLVSFCSGMPTVAAVTLVNAGLATQLFPFDLSTAWWAVILVGFALTLLAAGGYPWLDRLMKIMMVFLAVSTAIAVAAALIRGPQGTSGFEPPPIWDGVGIAFLIALMGWMPTPVDISAWPSLWMEERSVQTGHRANLREARFDLNLGYVATTIMAVLFLSLGALVMYGTGEEPDPRAAAFAGQLVRLYTDALGTWSRPFIITAAFTCMLSTTLTVIDGYPRVLAACSGTLFPKLLPFRRPTYWVFNLTVCASAVAIIWYFSTHRNRMRGLVDFVTTIAFLSAPFLAYINYRTIFSADFPAEATPPPWLRWLARGGIAFLLGFSGLYLWKLIGLAE